MHKVSYKLIIAAAVTAICAAPEFTYARGGAAGVGGAGRAGGVTRGMVAGAVATQNVAAQQAAQSSSDAASQGDNTTQNPAPAATAQPPKSLCPPAPKLLAGSYIGVQLGYGSYRVNNSVNSPAGTAFVTNLPAMATNWTAGALIGYGKMVSSMFYLGGELFIDANNFQQDFSYTNLPGPTTYTNQTLNGPTWGIGILPGIKFIDSTLTFVRLGWNRTIFKTTETITGDVNGNVSKGRGGFVFGVGIETLITTNYSVRGEFDHTYYNSYNTYSVYNTVVNPSSNQFMLSFIYHPG